ncbi:molecular chaperone [Salmonella enterica subsp. enterica serovar Wilhelmsburg]|nr:molecular chaperone [Salmonella enterica subsp. enterica serovar Nigeria]ECG8305604.1 molecular chaperone [Salmonella enterica subsp. enterica serovar Glostrup]ECY7871608.1 molecular chaperone [Salmonella enterica subsp. enterica serovar Wilhelmsburg]EDW4632790.1 molecular chaperone [Salmonella enterica subsp. enterica]
MSTRQNMLDRLANVAKNAPLQENTGSAAATPVASAAIVPASELKKKKVGRKPKNLQIPEDLWEAYEQLKSNNVTSLLMTPYILEAFREKLARDGAFDK